VPAVDEPTFRKAHASPAVRRFARELGADLGRIDGSGPKGRILKDDVKAWVKKALSGGAAPSAPAAAGGAGIPPIPAVDFSQFGEIETVELSRIKRLSGPHLHRAWLNLPMVTHHDEADVTEMEAFRGSLKAEAEQRGVRVTALVFIMKALTDALRAFPNFNASLSPDGQALILKKYFNVGIAVDTPNGLVVPVIRRSLRGAGRGQQAGARRQARPGRHVRWLHQHLEPRRHRRYGLHADRQRARSGDPRRDPCAHAAGLGR
jgi:pyruvate dehydrogenase E2 component (dihydrolipoamide acetyltransferase)